MNKSLVLCGAVAAVALGAGIAVAQVGLSDPAFEPDGSVRVPAFTLPPSPFLSPEAVELQKSFYATAPRPAPKAGAGADPFTIRLQAVEDLYAPRAADMLRRYPADVEEQRLGGVRVRIFTPKGVKVDTKRVLINVHGGGFTYCSEACPAIESLPIASLTGFKVVSIDYRMAPKHVFPAANEDIEAVYRVLLKSYKASAIGMYGCSAGGILSAQTAGWLPSRGLPQLGAVGIFGAGAVGRMTGDSVHFAKYLDGLVRAPTYIRPQGAPPLPPPAPIRSYFEGADMADPMVSPASNTAVLAKFPPTLLITGTRSLDMSPVIVTHSRLLEAGVNSQLVVGEGMGHCYIYEPQLPESQFAYRTAAKFFKENLE